MKTLVTLSLAALLFSCGGGGGGGGNSTNPVSSTSTSQTSTSSSNTTQSFSYTKLVESEVGTVFDSSARTLLYRETDRGGSSTLSGQLTTNEAQFSLIQDTQGNYGNRYSISKTFYDSDGNNWDPDFTIDWAIDDFSDALSFSGNALQEFVYWWQDTGVVTDTASLTQENYIIRGFGFYTDQLSAYLETEYVVPFLVFIDYGQNCFVAGCDTNSNEDIVAGVVGDYTQTGDMPSSGLVYHDARGLGLYHGDDMYVAENGIGHMIVAEGDGTITVDHTQKTITGSLTFDAAFQREISGYYVRQQDVTGGSFELDGSISGNTFSGTVTWGSGEYGSGFFSGNFFGPDGNELGGTISANDDIDTEWSQIIVSFIAENN